METNVEDIWKMATDFLSERLDRHTFDAWITPIKPVRLDGESLVLGVPSRFFASWIEMHHLSSIRNALSAATGKECNISFEILESREVPDEIVLQEQPQVRKTVGGSPLNPRYTFKNFVVGSSNQFAHAAAKAVAENPAHAYNPLFIYGGVGLGKTHIMQAIGNHVLATRPDLLVCYVSAERFMNEMIYAIQRGSTIGFRNKYRGIDVLLIDDIQFLAGKDSTQEEFFHTFNSLYDARKQIVLTSDRAPKEIYALEERLVSRFEWGLVTDIQPPDFETRVAILRKKTEEEKIVVPDDVINLIAENIRSNIRELEGSLTRLRAYASITTRPITLELATEVLKDILSKQPRSIGIEEIKQAVSSYYKISPDALVGRKRTSAIALPRQVAMYLARLLTNLSLTEIGASFGKRDHTTVIHACDKISQMVNSDATFKSQIEHMQNMVKELAEKRSS
ncbi:MAG: chromosomal replication initiator protein DnaA [bacterium]